MGDQSRMGYKPHPQGLLYGSKDGDSIRTFRTGLQTPSCVEELIQRGILTPDWGVGCVVDIPDTTGK